MSNPLKRKKMMALQALKASNKEDTQNPIIVPELPTKQDLPNALVFLEEKQEVVTEFKEEISTEQEQEKPSKKKKSLQSE